MLANGTLSIMCSLRRGVPQGAIFGAFFCLFFYINDLPNCLSSRQPRMSADDTHITCVGVDVNF